LYDKLKGGESLFYSFRAGLGINFLSLFSYYLSSPLNLFILLFKKTQLNMAVSMLIVLKIALSGLMAGIYFSSKTKEPGMTVLACAMAYALNSYMVGYCWNVMWLDALMIFPIVIMGIERLIEKQDGRLYGAALFYALYCNYYIAFMICIFAVIWYIFYSFRSFRQFFFRGVAFAFYSFLAAGMAAVLLIPAYLGLTETDAGSEVIMPIHEWLTGFADLITRQFDMAYPISHDNFDGNANLYIGVFAVFAVVLYFLNKEIKLGDKIKKGLLLVFFYVSFSETILNFIWHGFHDQYGIPNRFSFLYGFVLLSMLFEVLEHKDSIRNWHVVLGCIFGVGMLYISRTYAETPLDDGMYGVAGLLMLFYGFVLLVMSFDKRHRKWYVRVFSLAAVIELCVTAVLGFDYNGQISVSKFFSDTDDMEEAVDTLSDGTFYRSELADGKMVDENAWYRLNAVGLFGSTASDDMVTIMDSLGFYTGCNEYLYEGATPVTNLLLGVKYIYYHPEDTLNTDFTYAGTFGDIDVYENPTEGLSIGYMMSTDIEDWYYLSAYPFRVLNELCECGYDIYDIFDTIEITDPVTNGCTVSQTNDGEYYFEYETASQDNMIFTIPVVDDLDNLYIFYDGTQVDNAQIAIDGVITQQGDIDGYMLPIGAVEAGSTITVSFKLKGETESGYVRLSAANFDEMLYEELADVMTSQAFEITEMTSDAISGTVTAGEDQTLFLSIPYDTGWKIRVDGESVEAEAIGDAFLSIPLSEGEHTITMHYVPNGFSVGWKLSLLCFIIYIGICIFSPAIRRRREARAALQVEKEEALRQKALEEQEEALQRERQEQERVFWEEVQRSREEIRQKIRKNEEITDDDT
ncbi:MAG: YfhO family protein, partial [Clostridiales bacterium]|nr:YfhO family protein [Clostridiales bacterium]